jgi:peptidoglycan hydrolase CwlO-like protein
MKRSRRISLSAAVTTGLVGLGAAAVAGVPALSFTSAGSTTDHSNTGQDSQAQERQDLENALDAMRTNTGALDDDLAKAKHDLRVAEHAAAARASAARAAAALRAKHQSSTATRHSQAHSSATSSNSSAPGTHGTTGASGSGGGGGDDGGGDDGGGDDGGGGVDG